jgi:hypothetical protein
MNSKEFAEAVEAANYVILCKNCGESLGFEFDDKPEVKSHKELTAIIKEWVNV